MSSTQSDLYWQSRPYESRIGAIASHQSQPLTSTSTLLQECVRLRLLHPTDPPRPVHWGGYTVTPLLIELWKHSDTRLHDRVRYTRDTIEAAWMCDLLYP